MRILADIRLLSRGGVSGIEEYTRNLLTSLLALDKENRYTLFYNGLRKLPLASQLPAVGYQNIAVIDRRIPNKIFDFSVKFLNFPAVDRFMEADVVFSPHFNILKTAKPRVITFHDLSFLHHPYFFSRRQKFWHWMQDVRRQAAEAAKIIAVSEFTKSDLVNLLGVPSEKVEVIYSGISPEFKHLTRPMLHDARPYILYLGTLEPRKNVAAIIRAFNVIKTYPEFSDWQLVLAGRPGWLYENINREVKASPYGADIVFAGSVKTEDRVLLYNLAKVFVYPSFFEGFGFPPLEAQACGCPVVASDRTSLPETLGESALLVNPWKIEELAEAIREAALNQKTRAHLIEAGAKNVARFNWAKAAGETLKVLQKLA